MLILITTERKFKREEYDMQADEHIKANGELDPAKLKHWATNPEIMKDAFWPSATSQDPTLVTFTA